MDNTPSLEIHRAGSFSGDIEQYELIIACLRAEIAAFPPALRTLVQPDLDALTPGEFSQVAALLPHWLSDLAPVSAEVARQLGLAQLYGWWYYWVQDDLLDGAKAPAALLGGHLALLRQVAIYTELGLAATPCWAAFERFNLRSAAGYASELATRFSSLSQLTPELVAGPDVQLILDRAAPFFFSTLAQLQLAGIPAADQRMQIIPAALRCFTAARQLNDDASDWLDDLQSGHLNVAAALLMRYLYAHQIIHSTADFDLERLVGLHIRVEQFWVELEATTQSLCTEALALLAPLGPCRLAALVERQMQQNQARWDSAREYRANLRTLFGVEALVA
ncbi:MAG: hypothetical protein H0T53_04080 [Herpetosiphonaceae bacterium]|nr:hypothetical protein [Herpetosiphonaceae bacterium]